MDACYERLVNCFKRCGARRSYVMTYSFVFSPLCLSAFTIAVLRSQLADDWRCCEFVVPAVLVSFLYVQFIGNLYKVMTVGSSCCTAELVRAVNRRWSYCYSCATNCPPRASHCAVCNDCVLRRDHHCMFTGCCVGFRNHRFYVMSVVYGWLLSQFVLWSLWSFVWQNLGQLRPATVWFVVVPQLALITRFISFYQFVLATVLMSSVFTFVLFTYLFVFQLYLICNGQTYQEYLTGTRLYNLGVIENLRQVLGQRYLLTWLSPLIASKLPGNGIDFPTRAIDARVKLM